MSVQELDGEAALLGDALVVRASPARRAAMGGDLCVRAFLDQAGQSGVVEMVVGDEHELDVLQGVPER